MDLQHDLFEDLPPLEAEDLPSPALTPLAVPCAWRNRANAPCQRLARRPLNLDGQQMHADGRPLLHCDIACFNGLSAGEAARYHAIGANQTEAMR
ncbi:hypothetical protein ACGGKE_18090 (plasmid) [Sphingobium naphthae]|uniref:hypothetical protein n=1 Tax=Sphingobium naphthae TaxID=1886786 RepID=UPI000C8BD254|nr:hypothetical protein [Erythrobacter sp.]MEA3388292.1 hypothetical protein [Pseudomonadota bacterium]